MKPKPKEKTVDTHKNNLNLIVILGLLFVAAVSGAYLLQYVNVIEDDENMKSIEERLTEDGWILITTSACPACKEQKKMVNIDNLHVLECDISQENYNQCIKMEIQVVPTWINTKTNKSIIGIQTLTELEELVK